MVADDAAQNAHHTRVIRKKYLFEAFACGVLPGHIALARIQPRCTNFFYHILKQRQPPRSEEHTSELQSRGHLVCRLLLEKKKKVYGLLACTAPIWMCARSE